MKRLFSGAKEEVIKSTSRANSEWKWVIEGSVATKTNTDGSIKSCSIQDPELSDWIALGNTPDPLFTVEELAFEIAQEVVDPVTDNILAYGFEFQGIRFPVDPIHEDDYYKTVQLLQAGVITFPFTIKGFSGDFMQLTADNTNAFFGSGLMFKRTVLTDGWALKYGGTMSTTEERTALTSMTYEELKNFSDPRIEGGRSFMSISEGKIKPYVTKINNITSNKISHTNVFNFTFSPALKKELQSSVKTSLMSKFLKMFKIK